MVEEKKEKLRRGFAVMNEERVKEIAAEGGRTAHEQGTAHEFSREEAREAGRKGSIATAAKRAAKRAPKSSTP
jgi:general stress protein YciG